MRVGDDRSVDVTVPIDVDLLEHQRHAVLRVDVVEPAADVARAVIVTSSKFGWLCSRRAASEPA